MEIIHEGTNCLLLLFQDNGTTVQNVLLIVIHQKQLSLMRALIKTKIMIVSQKDSNYLLNSEIMENKQLIWSTSTVYLLYCYKFYPQSKQC